MPLLLRPFRHIFDFSGRSTRAEFWIFNFLSSMIFVFFLAVIAMLSDLFFAEAVGVSSPYYIKLLPGIIPGSIFLLAGISLSIRRLHDTNRSGYFILLNFIPILGSIWFLVLTCFSGTKGANLFGPEVPPYYKPETTPLSQKERAFISIIERPFRHWADFSGRATRKEFWLLILFLNLLSNALIKISDQLSVSALNTRMPSVVDVLDILIGCFGIFSMITIIAVSVRRLHDIDRSGYFYLLNLIPILGTAWLLILACFSGTKGDNRFGVDPLGESAKAIDKENSPSNIA